MSVARILVVADYYEPGFLAGGPIQSLVGMTGFLSTRFEIRIVTRDRDIGSKTPYESITPNTWSNREGATVCYLPPGARSLVKLAALVLCMRYDILYLNSLFSPFYSIFPLFVSWIAAGRRKRVIVAPRGELSRSSTGVKGTKKALFLFIFRLLRVHRFPLWQATSAHEEKDIRRVFGRKVDSGFAPNIRKTVPVRPAAKPPKEPGELRVVFLSRVSPNKNLSFCVDVLSTIDEGKIFFDIYGPIEDTSYWKSVEGKIARLPSNVRVHYKGTVEPTLVISVLSQYHFLFLPTRGENYGHVIVEALSAGCPVIISDQTPWRGLADKKAGWDIPLEDVGNFRDTMVNCVRMEESEYHDLSEQAAAYGQRVSQDPAAVSQTLQLFQGVLAGDRRARASRR